MFGLGVETLAASLRLLESMPPGPAMAQRLSELPEADDDVWQVAGPSRARAVAAWERLATWASAQALDHVAAELAQCAETPDIAATQFIEEVALETHTTTRSVRCRVGLALALENAPLARAALAGGQMTLAHARKFEQHVAHLDADDFAAVDRAVTPMCLERGWTPVQLATSLRRAVLRVETDGGRARHDREMAEARVQALPQDAGMALLDVYGDAITVRQIMAVVDDRADYLKSLAAAAPIGRLRFAALADLVLRDDFQLRDHVLGLPPVDAIAITGQRRSGDRSGADGDPLSAAARRRRRRRCEALVSIDLTTLLSLDEEPAEIDGLGPIPAILGRMVAADATLRRLVSDPRTGETLDVGRHSYAPSDALAAFIRVRDRTCRFPGCSRSTGTEIDHIEPRMDQGETTRHNLHLLCRRHHLLKTAGKVTCHRGPDGRLEWRTRHGRTYRGSPPEGRTRPWITRPKELTFTHNE